MEKINDYKEGFRYYADHTPAGAKILFNMLCKEYERKIEDQRKENERLKMEVQAESHNHEYTKFLLKESSLKFEIVTGQTNKAQKELLKLYEGNKDKLKGDKDGENLDRLS